MRCYSNLHGYEVETLPPPLGSAAYFVRRDDGLRRALAERGQGGGVAEL